MAQQNPWKKQMQQNRNPINTDSTPPISQFPPQQKITPPWMKNKQPTSSTTPVNNQPSWIKSNPSNTNNDSGSTPPWVKAKQNTNNDSGSTPPWMKGKQTSNNSTGQLNKQAQQTVSTGPAWMQKKLVQQQSTTSSVPAWKAGGTAFGADKKKKEEEERLRKEQEQRERIQRQQQERKRLEKEKDQENEKKAREIMSEEDQLSKKREQSDRQKQMQQKRAEEQKKKLDEQERLKSQKKTKTKSASKQQSQTRSPPGKQAPLYTQYLYYFAESTNPNLQYKQKLAYQINLLRVCHEFNDQMQQQAIRIVAESQQNPAKSVLSSAKKNKIINLDQILTQVYYAFCEGQQNEQSSAQLNPKQEQKPTIRFDMSQIQRLQRVFNFYNHVNNIICSCNRKQSTIMTRFRTPLFSLVQYKGIAFLSQSYTQELLQTQALLPFELKEIVTDFALIEKELKQKYHYHLGKTDLAIKKLFIQQFQEQVYIIYLKNWDLKVSKHGQIPNQTTIEQLTTDYYFLTQSIGRKFPLIPQTEFQVFKKVKTQPFSELADVLHLAQCIFVVYSSCQGEVEEKEFWELILSQSQQIWNLIRFAGYKGKLHKDKRFLFKLFQLYSGVQIKFETKKSSKQQKLCVKGSKCIKGVYDFVRLEFIEVIHNFDKYLKDRRYQLAEHSLSLYKDLQAITSPKRLLFEQGTEEKSSDSNSLNCILHQSKYLISKHEFRLVAKILERSVKDSQAHNNKSFANIPINMELLMVYIKLKQESKILQTFSKLLQLVEFYFGTDSLINATLYQMLGSYYSFKAKQTQSSVQSHVITLYEHAVSIVLGFYGDQSEVIAEVYLSRAVSFLNLLNFDMFYKDIDHSLKIFKSHSRKKDKIAECLFHKGRAKLLQNNSQGKSQATQLIEQSSSIYNRISHFSQAIDGYLIVIQVLDEKVDEWMKKIEVISNQVIGTLINSFKSIKYLSKAVSVILSKIDSQLMGLISDMDEKQKHRRLNEFKIEEEDEIQQKHRQLYIDFEQSMKGFSNFVDMIKWLGWTAISMAKTQSSNSLSKQKFMSIAKVLSSLMVINVSQRKHNREEQNKEQLGPLNSQSEIWNQSESSRIKKSNKSERGQYSPIGQINNEVQ